jgi:predicted RNase H-like HicB family nuclease
MKYRVLIEQDEDGVFVAEVPSLPVCISQGYTREEAVRNIREAVAAYLESLNAHDEPIPPPIYEELSKWQKITRRVHDDPVHLAGYSEQLKKDMSEFRN